MGGEGGIYGVRGDVEKWGSAAITVPSSKNVSLFIQRKK